MCQEYQFVQLKAPAVVKLYKKPARNENEKTDLGNFATKKVSRAVEVTMTFN